MAATWRDLAGSMRISLAQTPLNWCGENLTSKHMHAGVPGAGVQQRWVACSQALLLRKLHT